MQTVFESLKQKLKEKNINLSHQRLKVLEYLIQNRCHPTVEQIYSGIHKDVPTLSKTTVYNTLRILAEAGLVRIITIEEKESRYDIDTENHGHFKCESCGEIYDFPINIDPLIPDVLNNFKIYEKSVYFRGLCPKCVSHDNDNINNNV